MRVQVGPWEYRVRLVRGYVQYQGEPCFGLCDHLKREILIADVLDRSQRLHVFVHELVHAWWHYCPGDVKDEEAVADLMALAMSRVLIQVVADPTCFKLFDRARGDGVGPLDPPGEGEGPGDSGTKDSEAHPRVERKVLPGDGDGQPGWVLRIFQNPSQAGPSTGAAAD